MAFRIAFLTYPGVTQLDMTGPAQVLHRMPGASVAYVWHSRDPVMSDCDLALVPTATLAKPVQYDMVCVPGGYGCTDVMHDAVALQWLRDQAAGAKLMTSVCTGSLILGAAGLLKGYKAGCHWGWGHSLPLFGAVWVQERVVIDRDRITAGGVTAGIDFAFRIIEHLHGRDVTEAIQLALEYDPAPLSGGTPATARPEIIERVKAITAARMGDRQARIDAAAAALA